MDIKDQINGRTVTVDPHTAFVYPTTATVTSSWPNEPPCLFRLERCIALVRRTSSI
jgi:hypothetical protein